MRRRRILQLLLFGAVVLLVPSLVSAICEASSGQCYYIAPNGNDANTGTLASPFQTIEPALRQVQPGDYIYFRSGTYGLANMMAVPQWQAPDRHSFWPVSDSSAGFSIASGTSSNPITVSGYPGDSQRPLLDGTGYDDVWLTGKSFWTFQDMRLKGSSFSLSPLDNQDALHDITIQRMEIFDVAQYGGANPGIIKIDRGHRYGAYNIFILNNELHDLYDIQDTSWTGPQSRYDAQHFGSVTTITALDYFPEEGDFHENIHIVGNHIYNVPHAFFFKNVGFGPYIIRDNYVHDSYGMGFWGVSNIYVENNIFHDIGGSPYYNGPQGKMSSYPQAYPKARANNWHFTDNTYVDIGILATFNDGGGHTVSGNVFYGFDNSRFWGGPAMMRVGSNSGEPQDVTQGLLSTVSSNDNCFIHPDGSIPLAMRIDPTVSFYDRFQAASLFGWDTRSVFQQSTNKALVFRNPSADDYLSLSSGPCSGYGATGASSGPISLKPSIPERNGPSITLQQPPSSLSSGTTSVTVQLTTNENSWCWFKDPRYGWSNPALRSNIFSSTGGMSHSHTFTAYTDGSHYVTVICRDQYANRGERQVSFAIGSGNAPSPVNGVCGSRNTTYSSSVSSWPSGSSYCQSGSPSSQPSFPSAGSSVSWSCSGSNGGSSSGTCTASRQSPSTPLPTGCPAGDGVFNFCLYDDVTMTNEVASGAISLIDFDWGVGSPDPVVGSDTFSVRYRGNFQFSQGTYQFSATSDDGVRVFVDGVLIIDAWFDQGPTTYSGSVDLSGSHEVVVEYYENSGGAVLQVDWMLISTPSCQDGATRSCGSSVGSCQVGVETCSGGLWGSCVGSVGPVSEVCDGLDNDCDGLTDEGVTNACGTCGSTPVEVCNGFDDDCDGVVDDGLTCGDPEAPLPGDVDGDGDVDMSDLSYVSLRYGSSDLSADLSGDGVVDLFDVVIVARNFGSSSPDPVPVNGVCGSNARTYESSVMSWPSSDFCSSGSVSPGSPVFPAEASSVTWSCSGSDGGDSTSCTAFREGPVGPICGDGTCSSGEDCSSCSEDCGSCSSLTFPVLHWTFDDASGSVASDSSGNGYAGSITGASWTSGYLDSALRFSGSGVVSGPDLDFPSGGFTLSAWVQTTSTTTSPITIIAKRSGQYVGDIHLGLRYGSVWSTVKDSSQAWPEATGTSTIADGQWHHVALRVDGATLQVFVDGVLEDTTSYSGSIADEPASWEVGSYAGFRAPFIGKIDDVRIYDSALSSSDIVGLAQVDGNSPVSVCGNGIVESGEACDDGNVVSGDGCSSSCQYETPPPTGATISVDSSQRYQTIRQWIQGEQAGQDEPSWPLVKDQVLALANELYPTGVSLGVQSGLENPVDYWSQHRAGQIDYNTFKNHWYDDVNDNSDPYTINPAGFQWDRVDRITEEVTLPLKSAIEARGDTFWLNILYIDFAQSGRIHGQNIHRDNPEEYAEYMLALFQHLDQNYGLVPDSIEILLEPVNTNWPNNPSLANMGRALVATGDRLAQNGYYPDFIAPSCSQTYNCERWLNEMLTVPRVSEYLDVYSYHRYDPGSALQNMPTIAASAQNKGLEVGMLEWMKSTKESFYEDLTIGQVSYWNRLNLAWPSVAHSTVSEPNTPIWVDVRDPANPKVQLSQVGWYNRQYYKWVRPGAVRIGASGNSNFKPTAFINDDGTYAVVVLVYSPGSEFTVSGLPAGTYGLSYADSQSYDNNLPDQTISAGGLIRTSIPGEGIITIYQK